MSTYRFSIEDCTNFKMYFGTGGATLSIANDPLDDFKSLPSML